MRMDIGLYREDEQFSFTSSAYMECYSSDSTSFTADQNDLFEEIRPMPQPPIQIFEWHSDDTEKELHSDTDMIDQSNTCSVVKALNVSPSTKDEIQKRFGLPNWQPTLQPPVKSEDVPIDTTYIAEEHLQIINNKTAASLQEIIKLPEIAKNIDPVHISLVNIKIEDSCNTKIASENHESDNSRRNSESSDLLNTSFSSTELTNFDIAEYIFEENKQSKKSIDMPEVQTQYVNNKKEPVLEDNSIYINSVVNLNIPKRVVKAAVKKIDLKAQKYIIENDNKKSFSEDECDIDIETVSEEESSPVLEAGDLTELLEQFEATEDKNKEHIKNNSNQINRNEQNVSLNAKVEIKTEKEETKKNILKPVERKLIKIKQLKMDITNSTKTEQGTTLSKNQIQQQKSPEQLYINNTKVHLEPIVSIQETPTPSFKPLASSNRQILDSLPQELINRIKESGKRKPITVIEAIPNNRKRSKAQEPIKTLPPTSSETVHLDHNYCSNVPSPIMQINKKDSGFASSEEDDRTIISRQPTVKNADGTLMVSLLKANTIRQLESANNQKKKLNFEEYKKRRNGLLTPKSDSQNCSPNASTCSSPLPEDEHQRMLKHQEKLRQMAQGVLNAAPKAEKKVECTESLIKVPVIFPLSPVASTVSSPQPVSPSVIKELPVKTEVTVKAEVSSTAEEPLKAEGLLIVDVPVKKSVKIEPPKVPPNLERKVLVSFGVNTDFRIAKNEDPLAPVEKLLEMKPLLEKASSKINENSLIASVIQNIPKVLDKTEKSNDPVNISQGDNYEHGEYKQFIYLEKDRIRCETKDAETQTNISLIEQTKRGRIRRRLSSSSSCSSYKSKESTARSRKSSDASSGSRSSISSRSSTTSSRSSEYSSRNSSRLSYSRSRSRSPMHSRRRRNSSSAEREHLNAVEERRIIYVGKIATDTTKHDLKKKFRKFGRINKISLHFRDIGDNYGFVTFKYKEDAHQAYGHGNDDSSHPCYKISFGGRREFCKAAYSDLDNMRDEAYYQSQAGGDSYDQLLKDALEKLKKRRV